LRALYPYAAAVLLPVVLAGMLPALWRLRARLRRAEGAAADAARRNAALAAEARARSGVEEERTRFFDLSLDLLCIAGTDGYFKQVNSAWEKVLGWSRSELTSVPYLELVHPDDREATDREAQRLRLGGVTRDFENRYRTKEGTYRWLSWRVNALPERGLVYGMARDVDDHKRVEQLKSDFISVVSHELRTPLTSIRGALGLIAGGVTGELPDKARTLVDIAAKNSERLARLINDILDVEKIESGQMSFRMVPQELLPLVEQALDGNRAYAAQFRIELRLVATAPGLRVRADADRLLQVLANLLSNAAKFSPRGGTIEVEVGREGGAARVAVTDHGPGVPAEFSDLVFEKFAQADASSTRQKGGTGLGLSISKAIVERHGGTIGFTSRPGETTFHFTIPEWMPAEEGEEEEEERA